MPCVVLTRVLGGRSMGISGPVTARDVLLARILVFLWSSSVCMNGTSVLVRFVELVQSPLIMGPPCLWAGTYGALEGRLPHFHRNNEHD